MASIFIYCGLGILLAGTFYGLFVACKGLKESGGILRRPMPFKTFSQGPPTPKMRKLIRYWYIIMLTGLIITGIGLAIGFH